MKQINAILKNLLILLPVLFGVLIIIFVAEKSWLNVGLFSFFLFIIPMMWLFSRYPDVVIFFVLLFEFSPLPIHSGHYLLIFMSLILFTKRMVYFKNIFKYDFIVLLWLLILLLFCTTIPKWNNIYYGLRGIQYLFILPFSIHVLFNYDYLSTNSRMRFLKYYFPILLFYITLQMLVAYILGVAVTDKSWNAFHSGFDLVWGHSVFVSAVLVLLASIVFQSRKYWEQHYIIRVLGYTSLVASLIGIVLIVSRASALSIIAAILAYFIIDHKKINKYTIIKIIISVGIVLLPFIYYLYRFVYQLVERFIHMRFDMSFLVRLHMYKNAIEVFKKNIFIGVGPEQYGFNDFYLIKYDPHNVLLSYGVSFGILGFLVIMSIFIYPLYVSYRKRNKINAVSCLYVPTIIAAVINAQVEPTIPTYAYGTLFWVIYAMFVKDLTINTI